MKNQKASAKIVGLLLLCVSISLFACTADKNAAGQSDEISAEIPGMENSMEYTEDDTETELSVETRSEQASEQETIPAAQSQPEQTEEPQPVLTADHELIYEGIGLFETFQYAAFKLMNSHADLYRILLRDDGGEAVELSLWSDQKEVWYDRLSLEQRSCYYVVELDGTAYLMRYCVETASNEVTMSYQIFGIEPMDFLQSGEPPLDVGSITVYLVSNGTVDPAVSFPIEEMAAFADTVKGYMENGYLAASTLHGIFEFDLSADKDNPVSPYLYDIFPWIPELAERCAVSAEGIHSPKELLKALQNVLPADSSVIMPDVTADGTYFITGDYNYADDESYLTIYRLEDGSYGGHLLISMLLNLDFAGYYENGILTVTQTDNDPGRPPYEMEISFQKGKATVTFTAVDEESYVKVGDTITVDRNEKPKNLEIMKNAEPHRVD